MFRTGRGGGRGRECVYQYELSSIAFMIAGELTAVLSGCYFKHRYNSFRSRPMIFIAVKMEPLISNSQVRNIQRAMCKSYIR
jgi:hypothetical protein